MKSYVRVTRRRLICAMVTSAAAFSFLTVPPARAADSNYPAMPVRIICASAAGGCADVRIRMVADKLLVRLGQRFIVENKAGAGTTLASALVLKAKPDGYTLLATVTPGFPAGPVLYKSVQYDPVTSFTPVAFISRGSPFLIVHPSVPAGLPKNVVALLNREIAAILREPGVRASYESAGVEPVFGSPQEVSALIKADSETHGALVKQLGIALEE